MIPVGILSAAATSSFSFLLDLYPGASVAYSLRKLRTAYTGAAIRVRRSSDNAETDIGFVSGVLDTASLLTFCGVGSGFVSRWYDQSGNANNAIQITNTSQPRIVLNGALYVQNGSPTMYFDGLGVSKDIPFTGIVADTNTSTYLVGRALTSTPGVIGGPMFGHIEPVPGILIGQWNNLNYYVITKLNGNFVFTETAANTLDTNFCIQNVYITTDIKTYKNNTLIPISTPINFGITQAVINTIGKYGNIAITNGYISEAIIYKTNQLSNRTGINSNINSFYTIF